MRDRARATYPNGDDADRQAGHGKPQVDVANAKEVEQILLIRATEAEKQKKLNSEAPFPSQHPTGNKCPPKNRLQKTQKKRSHRLKGAGVAKGVTRGWRYLRQRGGNDDAALVEQHRGREQPVALRRRKRQLHTQRLRRRNRAWATKSTMKLKG